MRCKGLYEIPKEVFNKKIYLWNKGKGQERKQRMLLEPSNVTRPRNPTRNQSYPIQKWVFFLDLSN